jgi:ABC-type lipoprotein export system ATPase subunit
MNEPFIVCEGLVKIYKVAGLEVVALQGLDLAVAQGELLALAGASGSGKTTLLNVLGGLDRPTAGRVLVGGRELLKMPDSALDRFRRATVGFVWQQTARNLIPYLTAQQNVELPMTLAGMGRRAQREWAQELLQAVGLWPSRRQRLAQLSGGQQQRAALATALANRPALLLADEPTGELDSAMARDVLALLRAMNRRYGVTTILVTHDPQVAHSADRVLTIRDGRCSSEALRRVAAPPADQAEPAATYEEYVVVDGSGRLQLPAALMAEAGVGGRVRVELSDEGLLIRPVGEKGAIEA